MAARAPGTGRTVGRGTAALALGLCLAAAPAGAQSGTELLRASAATAFELGQASVDGNKRVLGSLLFYDPREDIAGGVDGAAYGPGDRAWVEAALAVYDLYRQVGGERPSRRFLFRRLEDRVFYGVDGGIGHWHDGVASGQAGFFRMLVRSSTGLPERLRAAALRQDGTLLGPMVDDLARTLSGADPVLLIGPGSSETLHFANAGYAVGTAGLAVNAEPGADGGLTATVRRSSDDAKGPQAVLAFPADRRFTPSEAVTVAVSDTAQDGRPRQDQPTDPGQRPSHLGGTAGSSLDDRIAGSGEVRTYTVDIPANGRYAFHSDGPSDVTAQLIGPEGQVLARDDDGGSGYNFRISADLGAGSYTLEVRHCCNGTGPYTVRLESD